MLSLKVYTILFSFTEGVIDIFTSGKFIIDDHLTTSI